MESGLAPAAIAGISVAGAVVFVAVAGIAIYCYIQGRKDKNIDDAKTTTPTVFSSEASRDVFPKRSKGGGYDNKAYELDSTRSSSISSNGSATGGRSTVVDLRPDHGDGQFGRQRSLKYAYFGQEAYDNKAYDSMDTSTLASSRARNPRGSETSQSEDDGPRADADSRPSRYDDFVRSGSGRRGRSAPPDSHLRPPSPDRKTSDDSVESVDTPSNSSNRGRRSYTPNGRASFSRGGYSRDARSMSMRSRSRSSGRKGPPRKRSSSTESKKEKERKELVRLMSGESSGLVKTGRERDAPPEPQDSRRRSHRSRSGERRHASERSSRSRNYSESSYASDHPRDRDYARDRDYSERDYSDHHSRSRSGHHRNADRYSEDSYSSERSGRPRSSTANDVSDHRRYDYDNSAYSQV